MTQDLLLGVERRTLRGDLACAPSQLIWSRREDIRACRVYVKRDGSIEEPPEVLQEIRTWGAERLLAVRNVFGPRVRALGLPLQEADPAVTPVPPLE